MYHNNVVFQVNKDRRDELSAAAASHRLVSTDRVLRTTRRARLIISLGVFLMDVGQRLKTRYEPVGHWTSSLESR